MEIDLGYKVLTEIKMWSMCMPEPIKVGICVPPLDLIVEECEKLMGLGRGNISLVSRKKEIVLARQLAHATAYAMNRHGARWSLAVIGKAMGNKDYATVLHSIKTISNHISTGYKIDEIRKVADLFDLVTYEYNYVPSSYGYEEIILIPVSGDEKRFNTIVEMADYLDIHPLTASYRINKGYYKQYQIKTK